MNRRKPEKILPYGLDQVSLCNKRIRLRWFYALTNHGDFPGGYPRDDCTTEEIFQLKFGCVIWF